MSSSTYTPLDSLLDLACRDGVDIRPTLLRVITDLYVQKPDHSGEEETQYVELALGLIDAVDETTRATVAARLASYAAAPQSVLRKLGVVPGPAEAAATPSGQSRPDLIEEFFSATPGDRRAILTNLTLSESADLDPPPTSAEMISRLESAALRHNAREFARLIEGALGIAAPLADRIVNDSSGEPVVVAAKALGMKAAVLQRILLVLNPVIGQSVERVFNLALLYDEISRAAAARMITLWRTNAAQQRPRHAPLYWDDERTRARTATTPARHHAARSTTHAPGRTRASER